MLEGLDAMDWSKLRHSYGPAIDVPGQLRDRGEAVVSLLEEALGLKGS
jgi:hypothetical protein